MNKKDDEYDAGMGTTPGMWEMLSDILAEYDEKFPDSLNLAIYALRDGHAKVTPNGAARRDGYYCVVCRRFIPKDEHGLIIHDNVHHPSDMTFDEEEKSQ